MNTLELAIEVTKAVRESGWFWTPAYMVYERNIGVVDPRVWRGSIVAQVRNQWSDKWTTAS